jgi:SAM-dependent methyltransferase
MVQEWWRKWTDYLKGEYCYFYEKYVLKEVCDPVNFSRLDATPEAIQRDVDYALSIASVWLELFPDGSEFYRGKKVLEVGPGINFGTMLTLACHGGKVMVADRFLPPWDPDYHPKFYALLKERLQNRWPHLDPTPLDRVLSMERYSPESITLCPCSVEKLAGVPENSIDIVVSNAVLEHLYDLPSAFKHLARVTKPGGLGIHQVDFRDHRDYTRPLEHLLMRDDEFYGKFKAKQGEFGNRYRPSEMQELLERAGFEVKEFHPDIVIDEKYLAEFLWRLRQTKKSRYRDFPVEGLRFVSGRFLVVKKEA